MPVITAPSTAGGDEAIVIVGAGPAGVGIATALRPLGHRGRIVLIGGEPHPPYQRPPLSKGLLLGETDEARLALRPAAVYANSGIDLLLGTPVAAIDRTARQVRLADGRSFAYGRLALATGSRPRRLALPGSELDGITVLRDLDDARDLRQRLQPGARLVVIGAGYLGLELAAAAVRLGVAVTVLENAGRPLARALAPMLSDFFADIHRAAGVDLRCGTAVAGFVGQDKVEGVVLDSGETIAADCVLVAVGAQPNLELARDAGLDVDDGIVVDSACRTSDPDIVAAGDCTWHDNPGLGLRHRLESVQNANDQAAVAAATLCGRTAVYSATPWFWSNQYDVRLQMIGLPAGHDDLQVRGDPATGSFAVFYLRAGSVIAAHLVNRPREFQFLRQNWSGRRGSAVGFLADDAVSIEDAWAGCEPSRDPVGNHAQEVSHASAAPMA